MSTTISRQRWVTNPTSNGTQILDHAGRLIATVMDPRHADAIANIPEAHRTMNEIGYLEDSFIFEDESTPTDLELDHCTQAADKMVDLVKDLRSLLS